MLEYANRIHAMGHEVQIILPAQQYKWYRLDKKLSALGKNATFLNAESVDWFDNKIPITLLPSNQAAFFPPADALIATAWQTAEFAAKLPEETGRKFYFIQHYETLWTREKERAEKTYRLPFQKVVISHWLKEILQKNYQQDADVLVTPVDRNLFSCDDKGWNTPPRICLLHHDYDWKGYKEGIAAIKKVRAENRKMDLVVFGEKLKDPHPLFQEAGFEFEYHYRPTGNQVARIFSSCDIYLCPSWHEGLGMPAMEAMACRCALVTTDTGGSRDYAFDKKTALVSAPKDVQGLVDNLITILDDPNLMKRLSENGHRTIQKFDWEKNCGQLMDLLKTN
ncbi:MAG: glycosyltransferase family 1 [Nitrospinaceae bacterium]|nr:MAG: glycosyltransferase family 1 [Nitrospinaceae bacterium]